MRVTTAFQYTGFTPKAPRRLLNNARRESYQTLGQHFFDTNLPWRFTFFGQKLLGYKKRTNKYNRRKKREKGHLLPLVWEGTTRDRVLSPLTKIKAFATSRNSHVDLTLNAPALNLRANASSPNLREEITRVSNREVGPLESILQKTTESNFQKLEEGA